MKSSDDDSSVPLVTRRHLTSSSVDEGQQNDADNERTDVSANDGADQLSDREQPLLTSHQLGIDVICVDLVVATVTTGDVMQHGVVRVIAVDGTTARSGFGRYHDDGIRAIGPVGPVSICRRGEQR